MKSNRLLCFAHDAGSANVTLAYAYLYKNVYTIIQAFPKGPAVNIWKENLPSYLSDEPFKFLPTDTIVTGTSGKHSTYEMEMIVAAKKENVKKIITILDNTSNFEMRFLLNDSILDQEHLPNEIWIDQENFRSKIDYLNDKLIYRHNIYDEYIQNRFKDNPPNLNNNTIKKYNGQYLLILTEYISDLYGDKFGFDEFDFLRNVFDSINELLLNVPIILKKHPAEEINKYDQLLTQYGHLNIMQLDCSIQELVYYSKMIFGISSSVFKDAIIFQKPTYSIQIGSNQEIQTYLDNQYIIHNKQELLPILSKKFIIQGQL